MERYKMLKKAQLNREKAAKLLNEAIDLEHLHSATPGRGQWLTTETSNGREITYINWKEKFFDDDGKGKVMVERKMPVFVNGVKCNRLLEPLQYYTF